MNLSQLGLTAMNAARARLTTVGHNINNADTVGYSRQQVVVSTAGATATGQGFFGRGVEVDSVRRAYNAFLSNQLMNAQAQGAMITAFGAQVGQVNNLIADSTVGLSPAIQRFFQGMQAVASSPDDPAARQDLIGRTQGMVQQFNDMNDFLGGLRDDTNAQIQTVVTQINSHATRVAALNKQIDIAVGSTGQIPNDLLDQRDQEVAALNMLAKVNVLEQGNQYSLTIGNGQLLVAGGQSSKVFAGPSDSDPRDMVVYTMMQTSNGGQVRVPFDESSFKGGTLGGLFAVRNESLGAIQRELGQLATGMAMAVNAVQVQGLDLNGAAGMPIFQIGQPGVLANAANQGSSVLSATFNLDGASELRASDYDIRFDGTNYTVTRLPDTEQVYYGTSLNSAQIEGMTVTVGAGAVAGDRWRLMPTAGSAGQLTMLINDPAKFAAASTQGGTANGANMQAMADLQSAKILAGGTMDFNEAYSTLVNNVAVQTQQNGAQAKAQAVILLQTDAAKQSVTGVNLDEEYVDLDRYQQQFVAASKLIEISASLFDTLIGIRA